MPTSKKPPITFLEYERIFRTIHGILLNENCEPAKACIFFAIAGSYILSKHHGLSSACAMAGFAGYNLQLPTNLTLILGEVHDGAPVSHEEAFHCWIETNGYIIDLTAPLFDQLAPADRKGARVPPKIFHKLSGTGVASVSELEKSGSYMHVRNPQLMVSLAARFARLQANEDLVNICSQWYDKTPKKMAQRVGISNQHGQITNVGLSPILLEGTW